jgi:hypothetical protein
MIIALCGLTAARAKASVNEPASREKELEKKWLHRPRLHEEPRIARPCFTNYAEG